MKQLGIQCYFELYKIVHTKQTRIALAVMVVLTLLSGLQLNKQETYFEQSRQMETMDGTKLDNATITEIRQAIDLANIDWDKEETWSYAGFLYPLTGLVPSMDKAFTADDFYQIRSTQIKQTMKEYALSQKEMDWWEKQEESIEKPFIYTSFFHVQSLINNMTNVCLLSLLCAAICLSVVFSNKHRNGTDALIRTSKYGKKEAYLAKWITGFLFELACTLLLGMLMTAVTFLRFGFHGMDAIVQWGIPLSSYSMTFLQLFKTQWILLITASFLFSGLAMFLSLVTRNGILAMAGMIAFYLCTQFFIIPYQWRWLSQIVQMLPTELITTWTLNDHRLISVFGQYHTMYAIAPVCYLLIPVILFMAGYSVYQRETR